MPPPVLRRLRLAALAAALLLVPGVVEAVVKAPQASASAALARARNASPAAPPVTLSTVRPNASAGAQANASTDGGVSGRLRHTLKSFHLGLHRGSKKDQREFPDLPFETDLRRLRLSSPRLNLQRLWPFGKISRAVGAAAAAAGVGASSHGANGSEPKVASVKRSKPMLWIHVHKAGGTFMCSMATEAGERVVQPSDGACNWVGRDQYKDSGLLREKVSCADRAAFFKSLGATGAGGSLGSGGNDVASSGYSWGQIEREFTKDDRCYGQFDYGVMLREPISLMHSEVNYHPGCWPTWPAWLFPHCGSGPADPENFLKEFRAQLANPGDHGGNDQYPTWKFFDNYQIRLIVPALDVPPGGINATHLEAAKRILQRFRVVARLEVNEQRLLNKKDTGPANAR
eukprot:TRINITY_DN8589_c1_g6_i1.p1 TRINITY_DN8589_c1_g6~~TRINITY_DN8589_c1_g6_i1.p1  ORF type:complete len:401 (-),score=82.62 TRINITY_DN8589_c1_g6_i1:297-1499(-)